MKGLRDTLFCLFGVALSAVAAPNGALHVLVEDNEEIYPRGDKSGQGFNYHAHGGHGKHAWGGRPNVGSHNDEHEASFSTDTATTTTTKWTSSTTYTSSTSYTNPTATNTETTITSYDELTFTEFASITTGNTATRPPGSIFDSQCGSGPQFNFYKPNVEFIGPHRLHWGAGIGTAPASTTSTSSSAYTSSSTWASSGGVSSTAGKGSSWTSTEASSTASSYPVTSSSSIYTSGPDYTSTSTSTASYVPAESTADSAEKSGDISSGAQAGGLRHNAKRDISNAEGENMMTSLERRGFKGRFWGGKYGGGSHAGGGYFGWGKEGGHGGNENEGKKHGGGGHKYHGHGGAQKGKGNWGHSKPVSDHEHSEKSK